MFASTRFPTAKQLAPRTNQLRATRIKRLRRLVSSMLSRVAYLEATRGPEHERQEVRRELQDREALLHSELHTAIREMKDIASERGQDS